MEKEILEFYITNGKLNTNSIVIAHSIGNAYFIRFCKEFNYIPKAYIGIAPGAIYEYPSTRNDYTMEVKKQSYPKKDALDYIKNISSIKYCLYSDENDNNIEKFTKFLNDTNAKGVYLKYYNHFDGYHRIYKIPELIELITELLASLCLNFILFRHKERWIYFWFYNKCWGINKKIYTSTLF